MSFALSDPSQESFFSPDRKFYLREKSDTSIFKLDKVSGYILSFFLGWVLIQIYEKLQDPRGNI